MRRWVIFILAVSFVGCAAVEKIAQKGLGDVVGKEKAESIVRTAKAVRKGFQDLTPREEYYVGRAVAANIIKRYPIYEDERLTRYVNKVGMTVAWVSDVPETYGGYHFLVLDTEEPLAYAAPGGFVFISKGLMLIMNNEEELAGVLAHEVAHVNKKHGLGAIKQSRLLDAFSILVEEGKKYTSDEVRQLADIYEGSLDDIVEALIEKGYSRSQEHEADRFGALFAYRATYNPKGLVSFLNTLNKHYGNKPGIGLLKTHPKPAERLSSLEKYLREEGLDSKTEPARTSRFFSIKESIDQGR